MRNAAALQACQGHIPDPTMSLTLTQAPRTVRTTRVGIDSVERSGAPQKPAPFAGFMRHCTPEATPSDRMMHPSARSRTAVATWHPPSPDRCQFCMSAAGTPAAHSAGAALSHGQQRQDHLTANMRAEANNSQSR